MGWLHFSIPAIATFLFYISQDKIFMIISVVVSIVNFWSYGVVHISLLNLIKNENHIMESFVTLPKKI